MLKSYEQFGNHKTSLTHLAPEHLTSLRRNSPLHQQRPPTNPLRCPPPNPRHPSPAGLPSLRPGQRHIDQHPRYHRPPPRPLLRHLTPHNHQLHRPSPSLQHILPPLPARQPAAHHPPRSPGPASRGTHFPPAAPAVSSRHRHRLGDHQRAAARAREERE